MITFYRKERESVFKDRFSINPNDNSWRLTSPVIFACKLREKTKVVTVSVDGVSSKYGCRVDGTSLNFVRISGNGAQQYGIKENEIKGILDGGDTTEKALIRRLCIDHAASSANSPFISGCIVDNFHNSRRFDGIRLALNLRTRIPFANPNVSGNEKEYFLVGSVYPGDCSVIKYLGSNNYQPIETEFVSLLPYPSHRHNAQPLPRGDFSGSRLPRRSHT